MRLTSLWQYFLLVIPNFSSMMTSSNGNISTLLAICAGNSPVTGEFPARMPVTRSFDVFFDQRLYKRLSKQWWGWWFETPSRPLWCHCNVCIGTDLKDVIRQIDEELAKISARVNTNRLSWNNDKRNFMLLMPKDSSHCTDNIFIN